MARELQEPCNKIRPNIKLEGKVYTNNSLIPISFLESNQITQAKLC